MLNPATYYESLRRSPKAFASGLPALLYHKIDRLKAGVRRRGLYVSPSLFKAQMKELKAAGFSTAPAAAAKTKQGVKRIIITFDDGFANVFENALPTLNKFGFHAINFLVSNRLGALNTWDFADGEQSERLMDKAEVSDWLAAGHDIGAHTLTHPHLTKLTLAEAREEILASKKMLEDQFAHRVTDFAYPYGEMNSAIRDLVAEAGFERAWSVEPCGITDHADRLALPRFPVMVNLRKPLNLIRSLI